MKMCEIQAKTTRLFVFEHPVQARSWSLSLVKRLFKYKDVTTVGFDFCQLGTHSEGYPAKKRTRIMTNPLCISKRLSRFQCDNPHQHIPLMNGRASEETDTYYDQPPVHFQTAQPLPVRQSPPTHTTYERQSQRRNGHVL